MDELRYSDAYAEYIMKNGDPSERVICNGDTLLEAQEDGYLFDQFLDSVGFNEADFEPWDDSMDGDAASALASAGWGTDEDYGCGDDY